MKTRWVFEDNHEVLDDIFDECLCQVNKETILDGPLMDYAKSVLLPKVVSITKDPTVSVTSIHVHHGIEGLEPHTHEGHKYVSVLYLSDGSGDIVMDHGGDDVKISPIRGRFLVMKSDVLHSVEKGTQGNFRMALVVNYGY